MRNTLSTNIKKTLNKHWFDVPPMKLIKPTTFSPTFFTDEFYQQERENINIYEVLEEKMRYQYLSPESKFDKDAPSDMFYPYLNSMKINRDLNMVLASAYFGSRLPVTGVVGTQATPRLTRYLQDLNYDAVACDRKRNFKEFTNYILSLNNLQSQKVIISEKYEFLSKNEFDLLDIETDSSKPFQLAIPALRAIKNEGLLIYTILGVIPNTRQLGRITQKKLNLFLNESHCNSEIVLQGAISRFEELAYDQGKNIEMLFVTGTSCDDGNLTLCMSVHKGKKPYSHFHPYCQTCGSYKSSCKSESYCNFTGVGPLQIKQFNSNKEFLQQGLIKNSQHKFTNWSSIERLLKEAKNIPEDAYSFYVNKYLKAQNSFSFYQYLGTSEQYFVAQSQYHNMPTIYTTMPWELLMGKLHAFMKTQNLTPSSYIASFPPSDLMANDFHKPIRISYPAKTILNSIPRELKLKRQQDYGWED